MSADSGYCAFCSRLEITWDFPCHQFTAGGKVYDNSWPSCDTCKSYIDRNDIGALIIHMFMAGAEVKLDSIQVLKEFVANRAGPAVRL